MSDVAAATAQPTPPAAASGPSLWSHGSFSFKDLLDIVNPLQHLPVIGSIYRYLTGDEPSGGARIIGDSLYGGPIGFGVSVVSTALLTDSSGHDVGERMLASVFGSRDGNPTPGTTAVATAAPPPSVAPVVPQSQNPASPTPAPAQPVAMNQLFRSPSPAAPTAAAPEQAFLAQNAQFQHQIASGRGNNGAVLNSRPVPLELSSNLLPVLPAGARLVSPAASPANAMPAPIPASQAGNPAADPSPIAQKMLDALSKYEQLKKQEKQQDSPDSNASPQIDLSL